jgi:integrase
MNHRKSQETRANPMEQGEVDRLEAPAENQGRLVDPDKLQVEKRTRDLALFNLAIDSKLRRCDVVSLKVEDVAPLMV